MGKEIMKMGYKEDDLLDLLDIIIQLMMLVEKIETFQIKNHYNKQIIKLKAKQLLDVIIPYAERDYPIVFGNGEKETQGIILEYESLISLIRDSKLPQKVILSQLIQAYNLDKDVIEATVHRVLKKNKIL